MKIIIYSLYLNFKRQGRLSLTLWLLKAIISIHNMDKILKKYFKGK